MAVVPVILTFGRFFVARKDRFERVGCETVVIVIQPDGEIQIATKRGIAADEDVYVGGGVVHMGAHHIGAFPDGYQWNVCA